VKIEQNINIHGIICVLSFEVSHEDLRELLGGSECECSFEELEDLLLQCGEKIHLMLSQSAKSFHLDLLTSYANALRDKC